MVACVCVLVRHPFCFYRMGVLNGYRCIFVSYLYKSHSTTDSNIADCYCCVWSREFFILLLTLGALLPTRRSLCLSRPFVCTCVRIVYIWFATDISVGSFYSVRDSLRLPEYVYIYIHIYYCYYDSCLIRFRLCELLLHIHSGVAVRTCAPCIGNSESNVLCSI